MYNLDFKNIYSEKSEKIKNIENALIQTILEHIHDLVYIMEVDDQLNFRYIFVNEAGKNHAKLLRAYKGKTLHEVLPEELASSLYAYYKKTAMTREKVTFRDEVTLPDGKIMHGESILTPVLNESGRCVYVVSITRDITEQLNNERIMSEMAFYDYLTGLPNRNWLKKAVSQMIERSKKEQTSFALLYFDLDRFKFINDTLGHDVGDELLKDVSMRLRTLIHDGIEAFRHGGDEFLVTVENTDEEQVKEIAERILALFSDVFVYKEQECYVTPSIGISMFPKDGYDLETLIKCSDIALYRVKEQGRGTYQFYRPGMKQAAPHSMRIETSLRKAVKQQEFMLFYQPQVNLDTEQIESFEALIRWNHPQKGFIPPGEFIPIAEETGLIISIGNWVIEEVCRQIAEWNEHGYGYKTVAVNLSTRQFQQLRLVEHIEECIIKSGIPSGCLEIEITEGALHDSRETIKVLNELKRIGVKIAVDDFGTGYSSLSYLKSFPIDSLKIDQSFIRDILIEEKDEAITTTIIHLAKSLCLTVIAEGVEQEEQASFLRKVGCEKAQGFLFSRPLPNEVLTKHLHK